MTSSLTRAGDSAKWAAMMFVFLLCAEEACENPQVWLYESWALGASDGLQSWSNTTIRDKTVTIDRFYYFVS